MINDSSVKSVKHATFSTCFRKPLYDSYGFNRIPSTISYLLTGGNRDAALPSDCFVEEEYDAVIVVLIDAFGSYMWQRFLDHPFLQRYVQEGIVSTVTSQFPSTTAAHMTTIHTGLPVGQSGIYEWFQYEPKVDRVIAPLLFSYAGDSITESLLSTSIAPGDFFPFTTLYEKLHTLGVNSFLFQEATINQSPYTQAVGKGAHFAGYQNLSQGIASLLELHRSSLSHKIYSFFYHSHIDSVGHRKGIEDASFKKSVLYCLDRLEKELIPGLQAESKKGKKIALVVTADHGMIPVSPKKTLYLNERLPCLSSSLQVTDPAGSCRDLFLTVKEGERDSVIEQIRKVVEDKAEVWKIEDLITAGIFGKDPISERFIQRVGNTVILPYAGESVWWFEKNRFDQHFYASHGGLTPEEMETVFAFLPV